MSARAPLPAAAPREDPPAVAGDRDALLAAASRRAEQPAPGEREGKEAREERAAAATSAGARGEPSPALVLGHSVPQAAVPVRPLALHLAHKARAPGGPFGGEAPPLPPPPPPPPPPPVPRNPPEDAREDPATAGPEDKPPPPPPKGNPWTKKLPQHLSPVGTGVPPPAQDSPEAGECGPREVFGS